jgi:predicted acetyltransferase
MAAQLLRPDLTMLPSYADALNRGWSPDNVRGPVTAKAQLEKIAEDPAAFVEGLEDRQARTGDLTMPDGTKVKRLPGYVRWIWDGEFCGSVGFRWQPGSNELPNYVLGHVGYAVVPWKRGRGLATLGLKLMLPLMRAEGLSYVELTTDPENIASQTVITANGGYLLGPFAKPDLYGGGTSLLWRIDL